MGHNKIDYGNIVNIIAKKKYWHLLGGNFESKKLFELSEALRCYSIGVTVMCCNI